MSSQKRVHGWSSGFRVYGMPRVVIGPHFWAEDDTLVAQQKLVVMDQNLEPWPT